MLTIPYTTIETKWSVNVKLQFTRLTGSGHTKIGKELSFPLGGLFLFSFPLFSYGCFVSFSFFFWGLFKTFLPLIATL